jgi:hypothetical protein
LEAQFQSNCKPDVALRKQLADRLDMTPREVQVWVSVISTLISYIDHKLAKA